MGPAAQHPLPVPLTALIGRERELGALADSLRTRRLVTITGPGGVGKTRLALEHAHRQAGRCPDGVWLVDLLACTPASDVAGEVARGLGLHRPADAADALRTYLQSRDLLLVLDNCEHVVQACAELTSALLGSCPHLRMLATSREPLGVDGETAWRLDPLEAADAVRLFVTRAAQRLPQFLPAEQTTATIGRLCARLDRLPLAIELAAARVSAMSPAEILAGLGNRLGGAGRLAPPHHRTMRAAIEWSHRLLDPAEQQALRHLAVFAGGFDARAADAVGVDVDVLIRLVDKSMVAVLSSAHGRTRYRLLETIREYVGDPEQDAREAHLRHFASLVVAERENWPSTDAHIVQTELGDDFENVRAAVEFAAGTDACRGVRMLAGARDLFIAFGQADGFRLARRLLEACPHHDRHWVEAEITAGLLAFALAEPSVADGLLDDAGRVAAGLKKPGLEGWAHFLRGLAATLALDAERGRRHLEESLALLRASGSRVGEARSTAVLALTYVQQGDLERARTLAENALALYVAAGDRFGEGHARTYLGTIAELAGATPAVVTSHYRKAAECLRDSHDTNLLPVALAGRARVLVTRDPMRALTVIAAASAVRDQVGGGFPPFFRARIDRIRAAADRAVGADAARVWAEGRRVPVEDAIALAFGTKSGRPRPTSGLSTREDEVARFVSDGLSNKEIAARLQLSVRTVESHVEHALAVLGLANRTQLAVWVRTRIP
ncbi:MAG TPA: LuxR C-terminal-related transcriptional regulator [Amycolatopsis sp.]|nr:LuxR C-terminal-related transcriptional regulator [Amycolatopsis sp.]